MIRLLGVPVHPTTFEGMLQQIGEWVTTGERLHQICTVNPEFVMQAQQNPLFYEVLQHADLCIPDGWGVVWALRWRRVQVPERVTGSDGVPMIAERAAKEGWRLFLLGAGPGIAQKAAAMLCRKHPALQIVGTYEGSPRPEEADTILNLINAAQPDILLVAYGAPKQDIWIYQHKNELQVKVAMGIGGTLDFITGNVPRAPLFFRRFGLEWLYRLYLQPSRWRRMLRLPVFAFYALLYGENQPGKKPDGTHD
ncbi:MAG: WecB/TagA/CpsF family glycosyltransferase [Anaerolineae bacterium]|nr:WecB/TagA/CpsF family glycosyltransferase [Anaerolineae bacterium]